MYDKVKTHYDRLFRSHGVFLFYHHNIYIYNSNALIKMCINFLTFLNYKNITLKKNINTQSKVNFANETKPSSQSLKSWFFIFFS